MTHYILIITIPNKVVNGTPLSFSWWRTEILSNIQGHIVSTQKNQDSNANLTLHWFFSLHNNWCVIMPLPFFWHEFYRAFLLPRSYGYKSLGQTLVNLMTLRKSLWVNEEMSFLLTTQTSGCAQAVILPWPAQSSGSYLYIYIYF